MSVMLPYILFCAYASAAHAASEALTVLPCPSRLLYVPCHMYFLCFARILNGFRWNSREEIITTNRLNVYIVGELEQEWGSRIREKNANRRQWVLQRCQRLLANEFTNSLHIRRRGHNFTLILTFYLQILYKFCMNFTAVFTFMGINTYALHYNIFQQLTLTPSCVRLFIAPFWLPWKRRYGKHLQRMSDKCSGGGIIWQRARLFAV